MSKFTVAGLSIVTILLIIFIVYAVIHWYYVYKYKPIPVGTPPKALNLFKGGEYYN